MRRVSIGGLALLGIGMASAATAHDVGGSASHVHGVTDAFASGFAHPFGGIDHLAAIVAVGLLAVALGRRARLWLPASFMAAMLGGFALGTGAVPLPGVEAMALLSGAIVAAFALSPRKLPLAAAGGLVAFFGLFHGHAHGAEMGLAVAALPFAAGFLTATASVQGAIIGAASLLARRPAPRRSAARA